MPIIATLKINSTLAYTGGSSPPIWERPQLGIFGRSYRGPTECSTVAHSTVSLYSYKNATPNTTTKGLGGVQKKYYLHIGSGHPQVHTGGGDAISLKS